MVSSTSPPTRTEASVPGIRNERGKLPPAFGTGGAGASVCGSAGRASWSIRDWIDE